MLYKCTDIVRLFLFAQVLLVVILGCDVVLVCSGEAATGGGEEAAVRHQGPAEASRPHRAGLKLQL